MLIRALVILLLVGTVGCGSAKTERKKRNDFFQYHLALWNYQETVGHLPPASAALNYSDDTADGPLISWRVRVLPYLENQTAWNEYRKDEPWDSPHNKELLGSLEHDILKYNDEGKTVHVVFTGPGTVYEGTKGIPLDQISDDPATTLMLIECPRSKAVVWNQPIDLVFDPKNPLAALGEIPADGLWAAFCDGSVTRLSKEYIEENLAAIITRNGGEEVEVPPERR